MSNNNTESQDYELGFEAGEAWAKHRAEADELERLARVRGMHIIDWDEQFEEDRSQTYTVAQRFALFVILDPNDAPGRAQADEFWFAAVDMPVEKLRPEFVQGFVKGALDVWEKVADEV